MLAWLHGDRLQRGGQKAIGHFHRPEEQAALRSALYQLYWRWIYAWLIGDHEVASTLARVHRNYWWHDHGAWEEPVVLGARRIELTPDWLRKRRIRRVLIDISIEDNIPLIIETLREAIDREPSIDLLCDAHRIEEHRGHWGLAAVHGRTPGRLGLLKTFPSVFRRFYDLVVTDAVLEPRRPTSLTGRRAALFHHGRLYAAANRPVRAILGFAVSPLIAKLILRLTARHFRISSPGVPSSKTVPDPGHIAVDHAAVIPAWARHWPLPFWLRPTKRLSLTEALSEAPNAERSGGFAHWKAARDQIIQLSGAPPLREDSPLFSILVPVCDPRPEWLHACIDSVLAQTLSNWELILVDDASTQTRVRDLVATAPAQDPRIRSRLNDRRGGVSAATNAAAALAQGDLLVFLDHDDRLDPRALAALTTAIEQHPHPDRIAILYADEDRFDHAESHFHPGFKPGYSPQLLLGTNYMHHPVVIRRDLFERLGGLRSALDGSQDHDLLLRATEQGGEVVHIADLLYHMRVHPGSLAAGPAAKPEAHERGRRAIAEALERRGLSAEVQAVTGRPGFSRIRYQLGEWPSVSVLLLVEHGIAVDPSAWIPHQVIQVELGQQSPGDALNRAMTDAAGEVLVIASSGLRPQPGWEDWLLPHMLHEDIGLVGARLEYADDTLFASGLVLGMAGAAGRWHHGCSVEIAGYGGWMVLDHEVSALPRQLMVLRRDRLLAAGGFDGDYLDTGYELDLALRLSQTRGLRHLVINAARFRLTENYPRMPIEPWLEPDLVRLWTRWGERLRRGDPYFNPNLSLLDEGVHFLSAEEHEQRLRGSLAASDAPSARILGRRFGRIGMPSHRE